MENTKGPFLVDLIIFYGKISIRKILIFKCENDKTFVIPIEFIHISLKISYEFIINRIIKLLK